MTKNKPTGPVSLFVPRFLSEARGVISISYHRGSITLVVKRPFLHHFTPYPFWYSRNIEAPEGVLVMHFAVAAYIRLLHDLFYHEPQEKPQEASFDPSLSQRDVEVDF